MTKIKDLSSLSTVEYCQSGSTQTLSRFPTQFQIDSKSLKRVFKGSSEGNPFYF